MAIPGEIGYSISYIYSKGLGNSQKGKIICETKISCALALVKDVEIRFTIYEGKFMQIAVSPIDGCCYFSDGKDYIYIKMGENIHACVDLFFGLKNNSNRFDRNILNGNLCFYLDKNT